MIKIYHNPRCRKSREGLQILQESRQEFEIIDYLKKGVSFDEFKEQFPRVRFKVLNRVNSNLSNKKLYEKGYLKNYVEDYLLNPLSKKFECVAHPN